MTKQEKDMWIINIENSAAIVCDKYGSAVADSVFQRHGASSIYNLSPSSYSEVFADLEQIAND